MDWDGNGEEVRGKGERVLIEGKEGVGRFGELKQYRITTEVEKRQEREYERKGEESVVGLR